MSAFETFVPEAVLYVRAITTLGGAFVAGYGSGLGSHLNRITTTVYAALSCLVILVVVMSERARTQP